MYLLNKLHLRISHHAQLLCYSHTKVQFHTSTHSEDIGLSVILQSDWSIASKAITQDILSVMEFEMEVKYQNNSPFRLFYRK